VATYTPPMRSRACSLTCVHTSRAQDVSRSRSSMIPPHTAAVAFVLLASIPTPILLGSDIRRDRRVAIALALLACGAVLVTQSRTGLLTLAAAAVPMALSMVRGSRRARVVPVIGACLVLGVVGYRHFPADRALSAHADTLVAREAIWRQAVVAFENHPALGNGYHFTASNPFVEPATRFGAPVARNASVHNEYLGVLADGGVLGAALFAAVLILFIRTARRARLTRLVPNAGSAAAGFVAAMFVSMASGADFESAVDAIYIWLFLGVLTVLGEHGASS